MSRKRIFIPLCIPLISIMGIVMGLQAGCFFDPSGIAGQPPDANPSADAPVTPDGPLPPDAPLEDPCRDWTPVPSHFDPCEIVDPEGGLTLDMPGTYTYDTNSGTLRDPANAIVPHAHEVLMTPEPDIRLVSVDSFTLGPDSTLRATGAIPLLIASWSTITVDGTIDVSSGTTIGPGAGANTGTCNGPTAGTQASGGGGGGGAGFGDDGGNGGTGDDGDGARGSKGSKLGSPPANVRGGCAGAKGGAGDRQDGGGDGGKGGGALQLTARQSITVSGKLHAGGQGGRPADADIGGSDESRRSGGGGGGSGGMLGLEAPMITVGADAILAANGGGGGGGCNTGLAVAGQDGQLDTTRASRGAGEDGGGDGGDGGSVTTASGQSGQSADENRGGGGGGGGVGFIIMSTTPSITGSPKISPAHVMP
jgi:hypothetical protein